jgi:hypothetical protein
MTIDMLIFAVLLVLCLFLSVKEWRQYRAGNTTQFAFVAQVVCAGLCILVMMNVADRNMRTKFAERTVKETIEHLRAGNMPDLDPAIHLMDKDMIAECKGRPFPTNYTLKFLGEAKDFAVVEVEFANGEMVEIRLRDVRTGPQWWPPFFATPNFKVSLLVVTAEAPKASG